MLRAGPPALAAGRAALAGSGLAEQPELASCLAAHCEAQAAAFDAVAEGLLLVPKNQQAAAAFAGSTARPEALLPWLREMAQTLVALPAQYFKDEGGETEFRASGDGGAAPAT